MEDVFFRSSFNSERFCDAVNFFFEVPEFSFAQYSRVGFSSRNKCGSFNKGFESRSRAVGISAMRFLRLCMFKRIVFIIPKVAVDFID